MRNAVVLTIVFVGGAIGLDQAGGADEAGARQSRKAARDDLRKLQGTWERVTMEVDGDEVPADQIKGWTATYEDDQLTLSNNQGAYRKGIVTLDPSRSPKAMNTWDADGPGADKTVPGIYELNGDTLKVCFARPGEERPTDFTTKRGSGFLYCVYKRKGG